MDHDDAGNALIQQSADASYMHGRYLYTHLNQILASSRLPALHGPVAALASGELLLRLWLVLTKHFIAKPACATLLPRFVSDPIYEMGGLFEGIPDVTVSASIRSRPGKMVASK